MAILCCDGCRGLYYWFSSRITLAWFVRSLESQEKVWKLQHPLQSGKSLENSVKILRKTLDFLCSSGNYLWSYVPVLCNTIAWISSDFSCWNRKSFSGNRLSRYDFLSCLYLSFPVPFTVFLYQSLPFHFLFTLVLFPHAYMIPCSSNFCIRLYKMKKGQISIKVRVSSR